MRGRALIVALVGLSLGVAPPAGAEDLAAKNPIPPEKVGTWRFKDDSRPVKAVVIGGSVTAWSRGNFGHYLSAACPRVEIVNRGKSRLGARKLRERFDKQVVRNRRVNATDHESLWLIFHGGLNSVGDPQGTNRNVAKIFKQARMAGLGTIALSLGPWGSDNDRRFKGAKGLEYVGHTRKVVDYVMGRLTPGDAFGPSAAKRTAYEAGELPDVAVDLYDSALRASDAPLRDEAATRKAVERSPWVKARLKDVEEAGRAGALEAFVRAAREIPQWYMRAALRAFDHIHPNSDGHRVIAETTCPKLPSTWGCDCAAIASMRWDQRVRRVR